MSEAPDSRRRLARDVLLSLLAAFLGAGLAKWIGLPLPYLLGSSIAVAAVSLSGLRVILPRWLMNFIFLILGIQIGSGITPEAIGQIAVWPLSFFMLFVALVLVTGFTYLLLRKGFGWDGQTALFSALPGAMSFVLAAASETRADMVKIAVIQSLRLFLLIGFLAPLLEMFASVAPHTSVHFNYDWTPEQALLLSVAGVGGALLGHFSRVPGGLMLGAMLGSGLLHGAGLVEAVLPRQVADIGMAIIGILIGSRLKAGHRRQLLSYLPIGLLAFAVGTITSIAVGVALWLAMDIHPAQIALAFAPGAMEALTVIAFSQGVDPTYVASHHVVRFIMIALAVPFLARWLMNGSKKS
ncbi:MAG: AbrB family transcriptional regulator [Phyllobacterium sp.]